MRELLVRFPFKRPVLDISWDRWGTHDNRRGPAGEVVWTTIRPVGWSAGLIDWEEMPDEVTGQHSPRPASWGEIEIVLSSEVEEFGGQLTIDYANGNLHVEAVPI